MRTVHVNASESYDVMIGSGLLERAGELISGVIRPCCAAILTDENVDALYGKQAEESLRCAGFSVLRFAFPAGEANKRLSTLEAILEFLGENHFTRSDVIVALGGGVVGDVAGFAAAVYARGVRFVQVPTTLLAAVDSSVGGKTAVDLHAGKNLAGCFHQPSLVITDTDIIRSLDENLLSDGAAEIIKYGVLCDPALFAQMGDAWKNSIDEIIERSVSIKRDIVRADEFDNGERQLLNLGHTFGHAIEKCSGFSVTHGQGVAIGMEMAAGASGKEEICRKIIRTNRACGLPTRCAFDAKQLAQAALSDKKRMGSRIALVLPERIGECRIAETDVSMLEDAFQRGLAMTEALQ